MFSDRSARWALPVLLTALLVVCTWWVVAREAYPPRLRQCIAAPTQCEGESVVQPLLTVQAVRPEGYTAGRTYYHLDVEGDPEGLVLGQEVTVYGVWRDGVVVQQERLVHTERRGKFALGIVGLLVCGGLVFGAFVVRRTEAGWRVVERG